MLFVPLDLEAFSVPFADFSRHMLLPVSSGISQLSNTRALQPRSQGSAFVCAFVSGTLLIFILSVADLDIYFDPLVPPPTCCMYQVNDKYHRRYERTPVAPSAA